MEILLRTNEEEMDADMEGAGRNMLDDMPPINYEALQGDVAPGCNDVGDMTFCMGNYVSDFMKMMFTMRSHHMLTDVVLEVGSELFHVHKVVLAAGSPYFKAMFTSGLKECEMSRVRLQGVCPSAMAWLVYFMYTGKVRITEVTVCQLLPAATMFQISNVIEACCAFLERQLAPSNAIGIANFAEQHCCSELKQKANQFIERRFTEVCQEEEFLQLTPSELIALVRKDELNVREECEVYNAVLSWVTPHAQLPQGADELLFRAAEGARLSGVPREDIPGETTCSTSCSCQHLTPNFLKEQMSSCSVLQKVPACREYLAKIFQLPAPHAQLPQGADELLFRAAEGARLSGVPREDIPGETTCSTSCSCQHLTPNFLKEQMSSCSVLQKVPACREYLAKIFQDLTLHKKPVVKERRPNTPRIIYVAGGYYRHSIDVFEAFNLDDGCWTTLPRLTVPRSGLGAAFLKGLFYAVGGRNTSPGASYDSDWVDVYNPANEHWRPCSPMSTPRHRVGVAVMDGLLYAVGGSAGSEYHKSVECYDPEKDAWSTVAPMACARLGVGVAVVNRLLYAVGGFDGARRVNTAECYHPENNRWSEIAPMQQARSGAGVAALGQYIYVVGGYDGSQQLASVERYDTERDVWEPAAPVRIARSALSLTALDNRLYAMGGYDGTSFLDIVEVYDPHTNSWTLGTALTSLRSGHASAVCYTRVCPDLEPDARVLPAGAQDIPMANNIIGTLSNNNCRGCL
ncbi:kelch-like ECH-associated protein 1B [Leguminivora glycinivorella]|uniref:kelch-like ECH-associated protein 1B n=1 Tax=Leguminivora glycinivorella TaxID=1035111 RepID=UPI00200E7B8A|nr:kelch-like ECH-associated protein 1B [Leguminivora glycinivorella]